MAIRKSLIAAAVALIAFTAPVSPSFAAQLSNTQATTREQCESAGNWWIAGKCANKNCRAYGRTYTPGETGSIIRRGPNRGRFYMCDGTTGGWVLV